MGAAYGHRLVEERDSLLDQPDGSEEAMRRVREIDILDRRCIDVGIDLGAAEMIPEDMLSGYAMDVAVDRGVVGGPDGLADWPYCHIDWDAAAEDLKVDLHEVEFRGTLYVVRAL
jgi:hypothetical protein